jgi:hypothetical protein
MDQQKHWVENSTELKSNSKKNKYFINTRAWKLKLLDGDSILSFLNKNN